MKFRFVVPALVGAVLALGVAGNANAQLLNGSLPLAGIVVTENAATVGASTQFTSSFAITSGLGVNDYLPIPLGTVFGTNTLDLASFPSFALTNAVFGSFATTSGSIIHHDPDFLDVLLLGNFVPGPGLPGFISTPASLRISINQSGSSLSEAITLNSPPITQTPEPGTYALLGTSGIGGILMLRRRKKA